MCLYTHLSNEIFIYNVIEGRRWDKWLERVQFIKNSKYIIERRLNNKPSKPHPDHPAIGKGATVINRISKKLAWFVQKLKL